MRLLTAFVYIFKKNIVFAKNIDKIQIYESWQTELSLFMNNEIDIEIYMKCIDVIVGKGCNLTLMITTGRAATTTISYNGQKMTRSKSNKGYVTSTTTILNYKA